MSVLSSTQKRRRRIPNKVKLKSMGDHNEFLSRIKKTLYYGDIPLTERFSLPVSELAAELYSNVKSGHSLERLCVDDTAEISRNACVSPCSLILALFYLERLKTCNPDYIDRVSPSELFVVSMMVASKFLHDDGEEDEVFNNEWANSAGIEVSEINRYEKDFLNAIRWEVFVNETAFWTGLKGIEREVARREGRRRGWFSYTELVTLLDLIDSWSLAHTLVMVSVVCLTSYTASVLTLVGSAMIASQISLVPVSIIQSNLQPAHSLHSQNIIIDSSLNNNCLNIGNNSTCFESSTTESVNSWTSYMLSTSTEFSWFDSTTTKSIENNDSHMNFIDKYDSLSRFHSDYNNDKSGMVDMMKMMIFSMESEKIVSRHSLINYFTDVQHSYNSLVRKTTSGTDAVSGSMNWLNNLFHVLSSSSPSNSKFSSPISLPVIDVTI